MAEAPPRDPKSAQGDTAAIDAPGDARERMNSNLRYLLKQPSTPWITFDREGAAEAPPPDSLDAGWGEPVEAPPAPPPAPAPEPVRPMPVVMVAPAHVDASPPPTPVATPSSSHVSPPSPSHVAAPVDPSPPAPAIDVPPPPAYMMAVVDQVLSESRPPPPDPGSADEAREAREARAAAGDLGTPAAPLAQPPVPRLETPEDARPPEAAPVAPTPLDVAPSPRVVARGAGRTRRKGVPVIVVMVGVAVLVVLAAVDVAILVVRRTAAHAAGIASARVEERAPAPPASVVSTTSTAPVASATPALSASPSPSAVITNEAPAPSAAPSVAAAPSSAPTPEPASSIDPKTGQKRASYLTISRAASKHYIFLDGKLMLGTGPRTFPVKCGDHTLAIDDRTATRTITVTCGGEYVVTN